jgi:hypothetical protein
LNCSLRTSSSALEADAHHAETSADRKRVLGHLVPADVSQLGDRKRAESNTLSRDSWFDRVIVIDTGSACAEQSEVATDGVLVERDQQIKGDPPMLVVFSGPVRMVRKVWPPRMIDW